MIDLKTYSPIKGFFDLRDFVLPKKDFIKFWNIQKYLKHVEDNKKYFKLHNKNIWEKAKALSGEYQSALFSYDRTTADIWFGYLKISSPKSLKRLHISANVVCNSSFNYWRYYEK